MQLFAIFRLAFASAPQFKLLNLATPRNSPAHSKKGTRSHQNLRSVVLPLLVNIRFQILFHSPPGVLFTFPSRYYTLSVTRSYLALGDGPPVFTPNFTCSGLLWILIAETSFRLRGFHSILHSFPNCFNYEFFCVISVRTPPVLPPVVWALSRSLTTT